MHIKLSYFQSQQITKGVDGFLGPFLPIFGHLGPAPHIGIFRNFFEIVSITMHRKLRYFQYQKICTKGVKGFFGPF